MYRHFTCFRHLICQISPFLIPLKILRLLFSLNPVGKSFANPASRMFLRNFTFSLDEMGTNIETLYPVLPFLPLCFFQGETQNRY